MTAVSTSMRTASKTASWAATLSAIAAVGAALLCIGHLGIDVPLLSALGPGGDRAVPVAAAIFAVGAALYAVAALGLLRRARWGWTVGVVVHGLGVVSGLGQFRGLVSAVGLALSLGALAVLLSPAGRALRPRR